MGRLQIHSADYWRKYRRELKRDQRARSTPFEIHKWLKKSRWMDGYWEVAGRFFKVRSQLDGIHKWGSNWLYKDSIYLNQRTSEEIKKRDPKTALRFKENGKKLILWCKVNNETSRS